MKYKNFVLYLLPWIWLLVILNSPLLAKMSTQGLHQNPGLIAMVFGIPWIGFMLLPLLLSWLEKRSWKYPLRTRSRKAFLLSFLFGMALSLSYSLFQSLIRRGTPFPDHYDVALANVIIWSLTLVLIPIYSWVILLLSRYWIDKSFDQGPFKSACLFTLFSFPLSIATSLLEPRATTSSWAKSLLLESGLSLLHLYAMLLCMRWLTLEFKGLYAGCLYYTAFLMCPIVWNMKHLQKSPTPNPVDQLLLYGCMVGGAFLLTKFSQLIRKHKETTA